MAHIFGRSPFKYMQQHRHVVLECAYEVPPLFEALALAIRRGLMPLRKKFCNYSASMGKWELRWLRKARGGRTSGYKAHRERYSEDMALGLADKIVFQSK